MVGLGRACGPRPIRRRRGPLQYRLGNPAGASMSQKQWGGRFTGGTDARVEAFTE